MTKKIVVLSVSGLLFLSFMSWGWYTHENNRFYNHWVKKPETSLSVSAADLYNRFQKDRCRADKDYVDKVIEVTGTISDVQNNGSVVVLLSTSQPIGIVPSGQGGFSPFQERATGYFKRKVRRFPDGCKSHGLHSKITGKIMWTTPGR
jgi:hypothetical protein